MKNLFKLATLAAAFTFSANIANANDKIGFADPGYILQNHPEMVATAEKIEKIVKDIRSKFAEEEKKLLAEDKALSEEYKKIDSDAKKLTQEQAGLEASLSKKVAALEKDAPRLRAKEIQARQTAIQNEQKAFQNKFVALQKRETNVRNKAEVLNKKVQELQEKMQKAQQENERTLNTAEIQKKAVDDINAAIKSVAESKGYTIILPAGALYAKDENVDLSEAILTEVKAKFSASEAKPAEVKPATEPAK